MEYIFFYGPELEYLEVEYESKLALNWVNYYMMTRKHICSFKSRTMMQLKVTTN